MSTEKTELMVAAVSFAGNEHEVAKGLTLPSDHPIVLKYPKYFVRQALGNEALLTRAREIEHASEQLREKQAAELRAARIRQGAKFDAADDATVESIKRSVRSNGDLTLIHDPHSGLVVGARTKPEVLERARQAAARMEQNNSSAMGQYTAALQAEREK